MKDLQLKDLKNYLSTKSPIRLFVWDTNESRVAKIVDFDYYGNYYITEISERNSELILHIQSEI